MTLNLNTALAAAQPAIANDMTDVYVKERHESADEIERLRQDKAELLDALKHIVRWHDQLSANDIAKAKAAIAKATGGE